MFVCGLPDEHLSNLSLLLCTLTTLYMVFPPSPSPSLLCLQTLGGVGALAAGGCGELLLVSTSCPHALLPSISTIPFVSSLSTYLFLGGFRHGTCSVAFTCMAAVALTLFVTLYFNLSVFFLFFFFCLSDDIGVCLHVSFRPRTVLDVFEFSSVHFAASR